MVLSHIKISVSNGKVSFIRTTRCNCDTRGPRRLGIIEMPKLPLCMHSLSHLLVQIFRAPRAKTVLAKTRSKNAHHITLNIETATAPMSDFQTRHEKSHLSGSAESPPINPYSDPTRPSRLKPGPSQPPRTTQHADSPESGGTRSEFQQKKGISRELTGERLGSSSGSWVFRSNNSREEEGGGLRVFLSFSSSSTTSPHPSKVKLRRSSTMKRSASIPEREENGTFKKGSPRVFLRLV